MPEWKPSAEAREEYDRLGTQFLVEFLEVERSLRPDNLDALFELGHRYTALGRYEEGLEVDLRLCELLPDNPTVHYNLACSQSLLGQTEAALDSLETAVRLGFDDLSLLREDPDLLALRGRARYRALLRLLGGAQD